MLTKLNQIYEMKTDDVVLDRDTARFLYCKYREHKTSRQRPVDWEIQRAYQLIAQGKIVIKALNSIIEAGVGNDGYPKLAIVRATAPVCYYAWQHDGSARFADRPSRGGDSRSYVEVWPGSFPRPPSHKPNAKAVAPLIPADVARRGLDNYHVLFATLWTPDPPREAMLLRRTGFGDLWAVCAAWEPTISAG